MPFVAADLAQIDTAISTGARVVRFQDSTVEYNSLRDLIEARALILSQLGLSQSPPITRQVRMITDRGL